MGGSAGAVGLKRSKVAYSSVIGEQFLHSFKEIPKSIDSLII